MSSVLRSKGPTKEEAEPPRGAFPGGAQAFTHKSVQRGEKEEESLTETRRHGERKEEMKILVGIREKEQKMPVMFSESVGANAIGTRQPNVMSHGSCSS